ncbi:MAG: hypothetical protein LKK27_02840 [Eubacterium sp.]|nr:hypothetical protein [Eubacterium sp.]
MGIIIGSRAKKEETDEVVQDILYERMSLLQNSSQSIGRAERNSGKVWLGRNRAD